MLGIRAAVASDHVIDQLRESLSRLDTATNADSVARALAAYLTWVNDCCRTLGPILSSEELDRLVLTRRYWALLGVVSIEVSKILWDVIRIEIAERREAFGIAIDELRGMQSPHSARASVIPDTNVWMRHHDSLGSLPWEDHLDLRGGVDLVIWIPSVVLEELDSLKRDRGEMFIDGKRVPRRTLARNALRTITGWFGSNPEWPHAFQSTESRPRNVQVRVLTEGRDHVRLRTADAELIDVAQSMSPFFVKTFMMTYDVSLAFRARAIGQKAVLLDEPSD
ncbi:MAG: hypothetical protein JWR04_3145 [Rhodoglobus sp.]|nr:hypothetical protein [Rhodoglobus sp.]